MPTSGRPSRILLADRDQTTFKMLESILPRKAYDLVATDKGTDAFTLATGRVPALVLLEADLPGIDGYALCRRLRADSRTRTIPIIMLTGDDRVPARLAAFEAGVDDYVVKPFHPKELAFRIRNLIERHASPAPPIREVSTTRGRIIAFFGTKGGVGKTTLSINFATALCKRGAKRVAFLDADFVLGTVGVSLDLVPMHTISNLIEHIDQLDSDLLAQVMVPHTSGVRILQSPSRPEESELIEAEHVRRILQQMSADFDQVIVDCQANYDERILTILEMADNVVFVTTPEIHVVKNSVSFFELIDRMKIDPAKFQVLLNRAGSNPAFKSSDIEAALRRKIDFEIRSDGRAFLRSANQGVPLVLHQPNHPISIQMLKIADAFLKLPPAGVDADGKEKQEQVVDSRTFKPKVLAAPRE